MWEAGGMWRGVVVVGIGLIVGWCVVYPVAEWLWWGLFVGLGVTFAGVVASGGRQGGGK